MPREFGREADGAIRDRPMLDRLSALRFLRDQLRELEACCPFRPTLCPFRPALARFVRAMPVSSFLAVRTIANGGGGVESASRLTCRSSPRPNERVDSLMTSKKPLMAFVLCLAAFASPSMAKAGLLTYTVTGGKISGSLNGTSFTNADWSITATADSSSAQYLPFSSPDGDPIYAPIWYQSVTPTISIQDGSSVLSANLTGTGQWTLESRDYSIFGTPNDGAIGFFYSTTGVEQGNGAYIAGLIGFNNLQTAGAVNNTSGFDTLSYTTSVGALVISAGGSAAGTYTAASSAVPEIDPATGSSALSLVAGVMAMIEQRRRRATLVA